MKEHNRWIAWLVAGATVLVAATALALTARNDASASDETLTKNEGIFRQLFPYAGEGSNNFEKLEAADTELAYAVMRGTETMGYIIQQTTQGYGGPIEVLVGLRPDCTLTGIHVGGSGFNETENLGARAKEPEFTDQFAGKTAPLTLGEEIDGISGATITSRAVVDAVNSAAAKLSTVITPDRGAAGSERTANASAIGYGGPVLVRLTLDEAGAVQALDVGGARFMETEGVGSRVREEAFTAQFTGKQPPFSLGDGIDAISGATISSQAAVNAINDAAAFLTEK